MMKGLFAACIAAGLMTVSLSAQQKPAAPAPEQSRPEPAPPSAAGKRRNVSIEVKLTDQTSTSEPATTKVVTMIVADGGMGSVRSAGSVFVPVSGPNAPVPPGGRSSVGLGLNIDANPAIHPDGSVVLSLKLEYSPRPNPRPDGDDTGRDGRLEEGMTVTLESGKPMVISRAADPSGNRKINVEVTATVMK
jgi:hypothetical protein